MDYKDKDGFCDLSWNQYYNYLNLYEFTYPELKKVKLVPMKIAHYHVINGNTNKIETSCEYEADAIKAAERLATADPGVDYVVMLSLCKSRATKPVITTRF